MARLITQPALDTSKPLFVRKAFTGNGHRWKPGDRFDWRRLAISPRRVLQLFEQKKLTHEGEAGDNSLAVPKGEPEGPLEQMKTPELRAIAAKEGAKTSRTKAGLISNIKAKRKAKK